MPITLQINHPDRMIIGVARGAITSQDLDVFFEELSASGALRYRKIFDVMQATAGLTADDLTAFSARVHRALQDLRSGPIAIVASADQNELPRLFASLTESRRPAMVFRTIREARQWLHENSQIE